MALNRECILSVKGNKYVLKFPNVKAIQDIEAMKQVLSRGMYAALIEMRTVSATESLDMIDMESYFSILAPELIKDLKCSFGELDLEDYFELKEIYNEKFWPWYKEILDFLQLKTKKA